MNLKEVMNVLDSAKQSLLRNDHILITDCAHEQTISAKFMYYLSPQLIPYHVDCEYNRQGAGEIKRNSQSKIFRPDIIVHERGSNNKNLIAIEVKPSTAPDNQIDDDRKKLRDMLKYPKCYRFAFLMTYKTVCGSPEIIFEQISA